MSCVALVLPGVRLVPESAAMCPSAARFCSDEVRDYVRHRTRMHEVVPLRVQQEQFRARSAALRAKHEAA